jgi:hypothetical protein|tara:strand:- start:777 stop:1235 length:459 start_codon:yes stop_codon:yes gene_type:complete
MATAGEIVRDALSELTVQAQEQTVPAVDLNTGIRYLNDLMTMLDADGVKLGFTIVDSPNDVITVPAGAIVGMKYNLAIMMANGFDVRVGSELFSFARDGKRVMYKLGVTLNKMNFPSTLPFGSGNDDFGASYLGQAFFPGCCEDQDTCEESN